MMAALSTPNTARELCRTPLDTRYFDQSAGIVTALSKGLFQLARFELPFGYCGSLEGFWQFTNTHARDNAEISTPGIEWLLLINGQPAAPYIGLQTIFNPWGWPAQPISIRLPVNAVVEFAVRVVKEPPPPIPPATPMQVAGRIFGRYWYSEE